MTGNVSEPVAVAPDARSNRDVRAQLQAHLEVAFQSRSRDREGARANRVTLEAVHHGIEIPLLWRLHRGRRRSVRRELENRVVGVVLFHRIQVVGAFE